jgi:hypothetical protein
MPDLAIEAEAAHQHAVEMLRGIDRLLAQSLRASARADVPLAVRQSTIARLVDQLPGVRAVLIVENKTLLIDSYNWPTPAVDLSNRPYIGAAIARPGEIVIGELVTGAVSAVPFVPVATMGESGRIAVAVVNENAWFPRRLCTRCYGILAGTGQLSASEPPGIRAYAEIARRLSGGGNGDIILGSRKISYISRRLDPIDAAIIMIYDHQ